MKVFGADRVTGLLAKLGMEKDEPIDHPTIVKSIQNAQMKLEKSVGMERPADSLETWLAVNCRF